MGKRDMKRFKGIFWLALVLCLVCCGGSTAIAGGPESAVLVVNADSASSKMLANHYIAMRKIPSLNVIYLNGIPAQESISLAKFKKLILEPVLGTMLERQITSHIDYIIYSSDFPTAVKINEHVKKLADQVEKAGVGFNRKLFLPTASINSLTFYAGAVIQDNPGYLALDSNSYYRRPANMLLRRPFRGKFQEVYDEAVALLESDQEESYREAEQKFLALSKANPRQVAVDYR